MQAPCVGHAMNATGRMGGLRGVLVPELCYCLLLPSTLASLHW